MTKETELILKQIETLGTDLRQEMGEMETRLRQEIRETKTELRQEIQETKAELREEMAEREIGLREEMAGRETGLRQEMGEMETRLRQEIQDGDAATRMILENEILPQIRIIAENHLDLSRKLDEIRAEMKKNELLPVRVSVLEKDVRKIKEKLAMSV